MIVHNSAELTAALAQVAPGEIIELKPGQYPGTFTLSTPRVFLMSTVDGAAHLTGPAQPDGKKPAWLHIDRGADGALVSGLSLIREGEISKAKAFNDFGILIEADNAAVQLCRLYGMVKGIHVKGRCKGVTIAHNHIGPTYQSNIVVGTSYGVVRGLLITKNLLERSYIEDGIQFMQDFDAEDPSQDVSNLGAIVYANTIRNHGENAIDCKGAALVVIDGNEISGVAGSNNGPLAGWNHNANASITRGANTSTRDVIIRNNRIHGNCSGPRMFEGWKVYHNEIVDNNYSPAGDDHQGYGIAQMSTDRAAAKNNLVKGHKGGDLIGRGFQPAISSRNVANLDRPVIGAALTQTRSDGRGRVVEVQDAGYFTDWFGRSHLPAETVYIGGQPHQVAAVDYTKNTVTLAADAEWEKDISVCWRSPHPVVGLQPAYTPPGKPTEPEQPTEPTDPPNTVPVEIVLTLNLAPGLAKALRDAAANVTITIKDSSN